MKRQPHQQNPWLRRSYSLIAPFYDALIAAPMHAARARSLAALPTDRRQHVLISGVGTGLDLPHLPRLHRYTALDFNPAMLARATSRSGDLDLDFVLGDSMSLPFPDAHFDHVVLHLIVAVVPQPQRALSEAARVLKPGGTLLLFDKFLRPGQRGWLRRALTPLSGRIATRMDVVFEELLQTTPGLAVIRDQPALAAGWFRHIVLQKTRG
ncbi:MAG: hypothetical protein Fur0040_09080 [Sideroxydans sp.]